MNHSFLLSSGSKPGHRGAVATSAALHMAALVAVAAAGAGAAAPSPARHSITWIANAGVVMATSRSPLASPAQKREAIPVAQPAALPAAAPIAVRPVPDLSAPEPVVVEPSADEDAPAAEAEAPVPDVVFPVPPAPVVGAFDRVVRARRAGTTAMVVSGAGFADAAGARPALVPHGSAEPAGFDRVVAARVTPPAVVDREPAFDTPVEVLFKPAAEYTDEARALGIEGEVVLEVEFAATRGVRVVRVVRGLGHGLDEAAARAVARIRYRPAESGGTPVDVRATVRVEFRLT